LDLAPDLKSGFEMVLLRALAFRPGSLPAGQKPAPSQADTGAESSVKKPKSEGQSVPQAVQRTTSKIQIPDSQQAAPVDSDSKPKVDSVELGPVIESSQTVVKDLESKDTSATQVTAKIDLENLTPNNWVEIHSQLNIGASLGEIVSHCLFNERRENQLFFMIDQDQTSLYDSAHQQGLARALSEYFGVELTVEISLGVAQQETPRAVDIRTKEERLAAAIDALNQDPDLQEFKQKFDANLDTKTVRPID
jgi:DNA polymerase-3 subunit gamma/tau